jgi:Uma2 family endonuclease
MPGAVLELPQIASPPLPRKRFTRSEVYEMLNAGLFAGQRFELIDGDLIDKMGQNPPHANAIELCMALLTEIFGIKQVRVQLPIEASPADRERSEPEPDLAVLAARKPDFAHRHPNGYELALVIEVADTTLRHDALRKRDLYARAGVPEYWVLDLNGRRLIVHRELDAEQAQYASIQSYAEAEEVFIDSPGQSISVSSLLP